MFDWRIVWMCNIPIVVRGFFLLITANDVIFLLFINDRAFAANSSLSIVIGFLVIIFLTGNDLKLVFFATGDKPDVADKTARLYLDNGYDYDKLKNSLSSEIDFAGDLNSSSEMKLHLATVLIKKVLSKLEN